MRLPSIIRSADEMKPLDSPFQSRKDRNSLEDDEDNPVDPGRRFFLKFKARTIQIFSNLTWRSNFLLLRDQG